MFIYKGILKYWSILLILFYCVILRVWWTSHEGKTPMVTNWDALGYYAYLPATLIYKDVKTMSFLDSCEQTYHVYGGGTNYQFQTLDNGNKAGKYFVGIAVMQAPFFAAAHAYAHLMNYPTDGFSPPYQWAIITAALVYFILGLLLIQRTLSRMGFSVFVQNITLLLLKLASNAPQYVAIDSGQCHVYLFALYGFILWLTWTFFQKPSFTKALFIGGTVGLATLCRPTEALMVFIPLLARFPNGDYLWRSKFNINYRPYLYLMIASGSIVLQPQLIYWKAVTDHWVHNVGSKWYFLNPYFRVLFGDNKGWFIYTPITILFVIGLWVQKTVTFKLALRTFALLNIWVVIAWSDWRYGGSYSTRALMQTYPVFAIGFAGIINYLIHKPWKWLLAIGGFYFIAVNLFQIYQYNTGVLHFYDMHVDYYRRIYLNAQPTPEDMSTLDHAPYISTKHIKSQNLIIDTADWAFETSQHWVPFINHGSPIDKTHTYFKVDIELDAPGKYWDAYWYFIQDSDTLKQRLTHALTLHDQANTYRFYIANQKTNWTLGLFTPYIWEEKLHSLRIYTIDTQ